MANQNLTVRDGLSVKTTVSSPAPALQGDINVNLGTNNLEYHNGTVVSDIATAVNTLTLTNKSMDAGSNTFTNLANASISASAAVAYSKLNLTTSIQNSDISVTAAIAYSKLNLTGNIVNADINAAAAIAYSKLSLTNSIVNSDIASAAAIAFTKLAALTASQVAVTTAGGVITTAATLSTTLGGTGQNLSASTGVLQVAAGTVSAANVSLTTQVSGILPLTSGGTNGNTQTQGFDNLSPATTKGDSIVYNGTHNVRLPVGTDGQIVVADSTQTNGIRYTTLQAGAKNYITYNNFENNATTGWSLGTAGTLTNAIPTGSPTFGSGASGNLSFSTTATNPLAGIYSGSLVSSAATTVGNMLATQAYSIDAEDQAKVLTFKFYYTIPSGVTNGNFSGTSSNSFGVAIYDVTNSVWLTSTANFGMVQSSGSGYVTGTCQTNATTASLRFVIYNANATAGAITLNVDDFYLGPQTAPMGPAMVDPVAYTPTFVGFGTVTSISMTYRRVGNYLEVYGNFIAGALTASLAKMSLPVGLSIDTSLSGASNQMAVGYATQSATGAGNTLSVITQPGSSTTDFYFSILAYTGVNPIIAGNANAIATGSVYTAIWARVPITGWSSNSIQSSDTDTRVVAATLTGTPASAVANAPIIFPTVSKDTHGSYSISTGQYTTPVTGYYQITCYVSTGAASNCSLDLYVNAVRQTPSISFIVTATGTGSGSTLVYSLAGQPIDVRCSSSTGTFGIYGNGLTIQRVSGPAIVQATESINMAYGMTTGTATTASTVVKYDTKQFDSHNDYSISTGLYTIPVSGKYRIYVVGECNATNNLYAVKNGTGVSYLTSILSGDIMSGSISVSCLAGDTLGVFTTGTSGTLGSIAASGFQNYLSIERIGN